MSTKVRYDNLAYRGSVVHVRIAVRLCRLSFIAISDVRFFRKGAFFQSGPRMETDCINNHKKSKSRISGSFSKGNVVVKSISS